MKSEKNILIFPGGSEIGLEIRRALKYQKYLNIYGGTSTKDHTQYMYKKTINLPIYMMIALLMKLTKRYINIK